MDTYVWLAGRCWPAAAGLLLLLLRMLLLLVLLLLLLLLTWLVARTRTRTHEAGCNTQGGV